MQTILVCDDDRQIVEAIESIRATISIRKNDRNNSIPIIILSAKPEDADKILGLNIGADDYLTKPFNPLELIARVKSQLHYIKTLREDAHANAAGNSLLILQ